MINNVIAYNCGWNAYLDGYVVDANPHLWGTEEFLSWQDGWYDAAGD